MAANSIVAFSQQPRAPVLDDKQREVVRKLLATMAEFRIKMSDFGETCTRLGIQTRALEVSASEMYDDLRNLFASSDEIKTRLAELEKQIPQRLKFPKKLKRPRRIPAGK